MEDFSATKQPPNSKNNDQNALISQIISLRSQLKSLLDQNATLQKELDAAESSNSMLFSYAQNLVKTTNVKGDETEFQKAGLSVAKYR